MVHLRDRPIKPPAGPTCVGSVDRWHGQQRTGSSAPERDLLHAQTNAAALGSKRDGRPIVLVHQA
jgi:hypothetical protein